MPLSLRCSLRGRRRWSGTRIAALLVAAGAAVACTGSVAPADDATSTGTLTATRATDQRFVVAISVDGFNPAAIGMLGPGRAPALHRMIEEGASTLDARTAYEMTVTLPNHTGMLTGRRIHGPEGHHVDVNKDPGSTVHRRAGGYLECFLGVVHDRGGRTALFASKTKFALYNRSWGPRTGSTDNVGANDGRDKIDKYLFDTPTDLVSAVVASLKGAPRRATFLHISLPDDAGHDHGFLSAKYLDAVERTDELLDRILDTVSSSAFLRDRVDVLLTADHGGAYSKSHGTASDPDNYTIPFLAWGVDVAAGADLYDLNPARTHPGNGRPTYTDEPPIRNTDMASLVTTLLGYPAVPGGQAPGTTPLEVS